MKKCPECLNEIVDAAIACKYCGHVFNGPEKDQTEVPPPPAVKDPQKANNLVLLIIIIVGCLVIGFALSRSRSDGSSSSDPSTTVDAAIICEQFVEKNLKSPKSADFENAYQADSTKTGADIFVVKSYVDSENSFGAMIRTNYVCEVRYTGDDNWRLVDLTFDEK